MMRLLTGLTALLVLLLAPSAWATTAVVDGGTLRITAEPGEANRIVVVPEGDRIRIRDAVRISTGNGCSADGGRNVTCRAAGLGSYVVSAGDRNDRIQVARTLTLRGRLLGGSGQDTMIGGGGPDTIDGGGGRDTATYADRTDRVVVDLRGRAPDGAPGEGDDIVGTERIVGTAGADAIAGRGVAEVLEGGPGNDRLTGFGSGDTLIGGPGDDEHHGGDGDDRMVASAQADGRDAYFGGSGSDLADFSDRRGGVVADPDGVADDGQRPGGILSLTGPIPVLARTRSRERDNVAADVERLAGGSGDDVLGARRTLGTRLDGNAGTDVLVGGTASDRFEGGRGFDRVLARDGRGEAIACGDQTDRVYGDADDRPRSDCESTSRTLRLAVRPARRSLEGTVLPATLTCPAYAGGRCTGAVTLRTLRPVRTLAGSRRTVALGSVRFDLAPGATRRVRIRVSATGRSTLARQGSSTSVQLAASGRDAGGAARTSTARLVLRR